MTAIELQVYDIFKVKFGEKEASKILEFIDLKSTKKVDTKSEIFEKIIQKDVVNLELRIEKRFSELEKRLSDMNKAIYIVGLIQFIAIVGSVLAIVSYARQSVAP